jgi:hypothetical protein
MSNSGNVDPGEEKDVLGAGSSTPQHISGAAETGTFTTDRAPDDDTRGHGSTDVSITAATAGRTQDDQ